MRKILIASSNRAEQGLLNPIMKELEKRVDVEAKWCFLFPQNLDDYESILSVLESALDDFKPDIVVVPCDRWEMVYVAAYAFHHNYITAHFHAGNLGSHHPDEMNRRVISCFSHVLLCNTEDDEKNLVRMGEEHWRIHVVGSTAFDHLEVDESLCPSQINLENGEKRIRPYDLVLLHPDPVSIENTKKDCVKTAKVLWGSKSPKNHVIWLSPNSDKNHEIIIRHIAFQSSQGQQIDNYSNLQRSKFLGLLKNCQRFIGNSSAILYEAPFFNVKTVQIGRRNLNRKIIKPVPGGSQKIAEILATIELSDRLHRKQLVNYHSTS